MAKQYNKGSKEKEEAPNPTSRLGVYAIANLARQYLSEENPLYARAAIDLFRKQDLDIRGLDSKPIADWIASDESTEIVIQLFSKAYNDTLSEANMNDLLGWYTPSMGDASDKQKELINAEFNKFGNKKYEDIEEEYKHATYIANRKKSSKEEKEKAKKTLEKYSALLMSNKLLQGKTLDKIKHKIEYSGLEKLLTEKQEKEKPKEE